MLTAVIVSLVQAMGGSPAKTERHRAFANRLQRAPLDAIAIH